MDEDPFVTIGIMGDEIQARLLCDLLAQEGIGALVPGLEHRSMLGLAGPSVTLPLRVRASRAAEARELVEALENPDAEPLPGEDMPACRPAPRGEPRSGELGPYRSPPAERPAPRRRVSKVALAALLLTTVLLLAGLSASWRDARDALGPTSGHPGVERSSGGVWRVLRRSGLSP